MTTGVHLLLEGTLEAQALVEVKETPGSCLR